MLPSQSFSLNSTSEKDEHDRIIDSAHFHFPYLAIFTAILLGQLRSNWHFGYAIFSRWNIIRTTIVINNAVFSGLIELMSLLIYDYSQGARKVWYKRSIAPSIGKFYWDGRTDRSSLVLWLERFSDFSGSRILRFTVFAVLGYRGYLWVFKNKLG